MSDPTPEQIVDNILSELYAPDSSLPLRNAVASNEPLAVAIAYVLDKIRDDELAVGTLRRLYEDKLRAQFKGPRAYDTVVTYVKRFLKRDPLTGKSL